MAVSGGAGTAAGQQRQRAARGHRGGKVIPYRPGSTKARREATRLAGLRSPSFLHAQACGWPTTCCFGGSRTHRHGATSRGGGCRPPEPRDMVDRIRCSSEFRTAVAVGPANLHGSLHASRCEFIMGLPPARRIIDLGGGHTSDPRGALVVLGYPYDFEELVVVDLPPDDRHPLYHAERFGACDTDRGRCVTNTDRWPICRSPMTLGRPGLQRAVDRARNRSGRRRSS